MEGRYQIHRNKGCSYPLNKNSIPTPSSITILIETHKSTGNKWLCVCSDGKQNRFLKTSSFLKHLPSELLCTASLLTAPTQ